MEFEQGMRTFETGANRSPLRDKLRYEGFLSPHVLRRYAEYMHKHRLCEDGSLREPDNWQKGIPSPVYTDSLIRHVMEFWTLRREGELAGEDYQETLCAILFNTMGLLFNSVRGID